MPAGMANALKELGAKHDVQSLAPYVAIYKHIDGLKSYTEWADENQANTIIVNLNGLNDLSGATRKLP